MAKGLYDNGEEDHVRAYYDPNFTPPTTLYVGLFLDSADQLSDAATEADITTEPTDGSYARTPLDVGTDFSLSANAAGNYQAIVSNVDVTVSGISAQEVDGYFIVTDTQANGGRLLYAGSLESTASIPDASGTFQVGTVGIQLS